MFKILSQVHNATRKRPRANMIVKTHISNRNLALKISSTSVLLKWLTFGNSYINILN